MCNDEEKILQNNQVLQDNLEVMRKNGIALFLEGEPSTPLEIAGKCVQEDSCYMADYVIDDRGYLTEVRYDKVSHWK